MCSLHFPFMIFSFCIRLDIVFSLEVMCTFGPLERRREAGTTERPRLSPIVLSGQEESAGRDSGRPPLSGCRPSSRSVDSNVPGGCETRSDVKGGNIKQNTRKRKTNETQRRKHGRTNQPGRGREPRGKGKRGGSGEGGTGLSARECGWPRAACRLLVWEARVGEREGEKNDNR